MDSGLYRASSKLLWVPPGGKSVFGGQVMGQALHAAQLTVHRDSWLPISLHSYFLKRGSPNSDIIYQCRETSNLRSFDSRSVDAIQNGQIIFKMQAQFARPESERAWWVGGKGEQRSAGQPLVSVGGGGSGDDDAGWLVELWRTRESLHSNKIGRLHPFANRCQRTCQIAKGLYVPPGSSNLFAFRA